MSIDKRLHEGFGPVDRAWDTQAPAALFRVRARRRRQVVVRRGAALTLLAAAVVVAVALVGRPARQDAIDPAAPATPTTNASRALEGRWRSGPVEATDIRAHLRDAGLADYADDALAQLPARPFRLLLRVNGQDLALDVVSDGVTENWDRETARVSRDRLLLRPVDPVAAGGQSEHRWVVADGELRLSFVGTTEKAVDRIPPEVWQRVLYDIATFRR